MTESGTGAPDTVLLSQKFWVDKLGRDARVLGTTLSLDGKPYQVIGIVSPDLEFFPKPVDFFLPLGLSESAELDRSLDPA